MEMLRAAVKHGISKALSARAGFEVWDFDIREEQRSPEKTAVEIRYRYQPGLQFVATITARAVEGGLPTYEIAAEAVPGEVGQKESLSLAGRQELFMAIERWTARIEEELLARPSNRVLAAQEKAISYLEKHLLDIPDEPPTRERIRDYRGRLDRLEAAVVALRATGKDRDARTEAIRREFACLRLHLEVLGERSFLHAVLVRLVKHFWDDENLRIVEAGSRAAQEFLREEDAPAPCGAPIPAPAARAERAGPAPRAGTGPEPAARAPQRDEGPAPEGHRAPPAAAAASPAVRATYKPLRSTGK